MCLKGLGDITSHRSIFGKDKSGFRGGFGFGLMIIKMRFLYLFGADQVDKIGRPNDEPNPAGIFRVPKGLLQTSCGGGEQAS